MNRKLLIPLAVFVVVFGFLLVGLTLNPREVPSPLVGKPAPFIAEKVGLTVSGWVWEPCQGSTLDDVGGLGPTL